MFVIGTRAQLVKALHPATERRLLKSGLMESLRAAPRVTLVPRMAFTRFLIWLPEYGRSLSDSGSNQEELSYLGVATIPYFALIRKGNHPANCRFA